MHSKECDIKDTHHSTSTMSIISESTNDFAFQTWKILILYV